MDRGNTRWARAGLICLSLLLFITNLSAGQVKPVALNTPEVLFTDPNRFESDKKDKTLLNKLYELVEATPKGEEITVCVFKFELEELANSLIRASERGVKVRVILNKGKTSKETNQEVRELLRDQLDDFHYIENTVSKKGIIHNKFILFSRVETKEGPLTNVVIQTSSNFQKKGAKKMQDMLILSSSAIYYGYLDFWFEIKVLGTAEELDEFDHFNAEDEMKDYKAYYYPKRKDGEEHGADNVVKALQAIQDPARAEIRFAHGKWSENRGEVLEELKKLRTQGALVNVVTNKDVELEEGLETLEEGVHILDHEFNLHTKFFLIKDGSSRQVWTGSHNLTNRSLYENFEVIVRVNREEIYEKYLNYFKKLVKIAQ